MTKNITISIIIILGLVMGLCGCKNTSQADTVVMPQKPRYVTHEEITTITYDDPYKATVQYFISDEKTNTNTEYLFVLLTSGWEDDNIAFSLSRGMDTIGKEYIAVSRIVDGRYEIRAYQDVGKNYFAYVSASCEITEYSLEELYAGIENIIKSFEKDNREIKLFG